MALPILAGLAIGAAMGGGIAALQGKDVLQGILMGGAGGALGGAFMPGAAGAAGAAGTEAVGAIGSEVANQAATQAATQTGGSIFAGTPGLSGVTVGGLPTTEAAKLALSGSGMTGNAAANALAGTPSIETLAAGNMPSSGIFGGSGGIGNFISQNKGVLGGGALGGTLAGYKEEKQPSQGNIREFTYDRGEVNPLFGQPGQSYYTGSGYTPGAVTRVEDYTAANGGIIALAEGGQPGLEIQRYERPVRQMSPEVAAYNQQIMERANQQYNVNLRPGPNQVPGSVGYVAPPPRPQPTSAPLDNVGGLSFNRQTGRFEGELKSLDGRKDRFGGVDGNNYGYGGYGFDGGGGDGDSGGNDGGDSDGGVGDGPGGPGGDGFAYGGSIGYNQGGISSLGSYSDGGQLLKGPGDGVSDDIPAQIGARQPARLADGEFVVPARIVSELGNGSTDAGAKQLYAMMDRVQKNRKKTVGKGKVAVDAKARKLLPA
jgi:hypothetical protein